MPKSFSERDGITLKTVMLVDDSVFMRTWLKRLISAEFTIITEAENGQDAIIKYKIYKPDIVLMDITMPIINGLDALKAIVEFDSNSKVVMNSSMSQKFFIIESLRLGAKDFVIKPHFDNLIPILHNLCEA